MSKLILSFYGGCAPAGVELAFAQACGLPGPVLEVLWWEQVGGHSHVNQVWGSEQAYQRR